MRMPRMTTRRWMMAVLLAALGLSGWETERRRQAYRARATLLGRTELRCKIEVCLATDAIEADGCCIAIPEGFDPMTAKLPVAAEKYRRRFAYYRHLRQKYEAASWHPWLPVEPDPPEPE